MRFLASFLLLFGAVAPAWSWGVRGHRSITEAALKGLPPDLPAVFREQSSYIIWRSIVPDSWRGVGEPFLKIDEDPNHGWFREQFAFLKEIPRSRYEFVLALAAEYQRLRQTDPTAAALTNVRWTGTLPYAAVETYERLKVALRFWRTVNDADSRKYLELDIAHYTGWLSHYIGDGAQPLHATIHHDGWQGPNPNGYTTDPSIHGRMESAFVDLIGMQASDLLPRLGQPRHLIDVFDAVLAHLDQSHQDVEAIYRLEQAKAWQNKDHTEARELTYRCAANGARLLRDLIYTAWMESAKPAMSYARGSANPVSREHPLYNPATGSAPAPRPTVSNDRVSSPPPAAQPNAAPIRFADPLAEKNFYVLTALAADPGISKLVSEDAALAQLLRIRRKALQEAGDRCGPDIGCHLEIHRWSEEQIQQVADRLRALHDSTPDLAAFVEQKLRRSGLFQRYATQPGAQLLSSAWADAARGLNRILDVYGKGQAPRYPAIDSVSYDVSSESYRRLVHITAAVLADQATDFRLFFQSSLEFALRLLRNNQRDEAARLEPLHEGENRAAFRRAATVDFNRYPYVAIVVPGAGSDRPGLPLSPWGRLRLELAVRRLREGKAPFVIVSGGYVHPKQTPFCEAIEMKRVLMRDFGVSEDQIIAEPHARHTTTNLRNAARLLYRYGFPFSRKALITTDLYQSRYIEDKSFEQRCLNELGYLPHRLLGRLSPFDLEFQPELTSLHADSLDPLDP